MASPYTTTQIGIILAFYIIVVVVELVLLIALLPRILKQRKDQGASSVSFMTAVFILILAIMIARILYAVFDIVLTQFDTGLYATYNWWWKAGIVVSGLSFVNMIFFLDKKILSFKFKGIFAYFYLAGLIFAIIYPINSYADFVLVSSVTVYAGLGAAIIPLIFLYIAIKSTGEVRRTSYIIFFAIIIYIAAGLSVNANFIALVGGPFIVYLLFAIGNSVGIILLVIGARKFQI